MLEQDRSRWTWVPLGAAAACVVLAALSMGAGIFLAPISFALSFLAVRRGAHTRSTVFLVGIAVNAILCVLLASAIVILIYDSL